MKRIILFSSLILIFTSFTSLSAQWAITYGRSDSDIARTIQQTSNGGYIIAGDTRSFGAGLKDIWILRLDSNGTIMWQQTYGGSENDTARTIQQTLDGGYIVAGNTESFGAGLSDIWVLKLDAGGAIEWQQTYGESNGDAACSFIQTNEGGYIIAGNTESFGAEWIDIWLLKLDSIGSVEWQQVCGADEHDFATFIQQTSDGGYIVAAYSSSFVPYYTEGWILKLDSNGAIEWQRTYGANESDYFYSIQQNDDGGYIAGGATFSFGGGVNDAWILKLYSNGAIEWQRTYGSSESDSSYSVQRTEDGGYVAAGYTKSYGAGGDDFLVLKLYPDGNIDSSCGFVGSSEATTADTYISPQDTNIVPQDTNITPFETSISPYDTDANVYSICPAEEYTLTISSDYGGTTDPSPGSYRYEIGEEVTITAKADSGYKFGEWTGDVTGKENPITITMDSDKSISAIFRNNCFLAKVFSGSSFYAQLASLRDLRDKYIISNRFGLFLVNLYYRHSKFFADIVAKHYALKVAVRTRFLPLIAFSYSIGHFGPLATSFIFLLLFILPAFLYLFFQNHSFV